MVGKNQIKLIKSLQQKKYRTQHGLFIVEGIKNVAELLESHIAHHEIYSIETSLLASYDVEVHAISEYELKQMSSLKSPNKVLGIFQMPKSRQPDFSDWVVAVDDVRDPGNLGTIIRLCDWFGIKNLICSKNTVDCYNPKVLQATMGSIARVNILYTELYEFLENCGVPIVGSFMQDDPVYDAKLPDAGILVMGNEANGISKEIENLCDLKISIPQFGNPSAESLNVATATSILLNEIRRGK